MAVALIVVGIVVFISIIVGMDAFTRRRRPEARIERTRKWRRGDGGPG